MGRESLGYYNESICSIPLDSNTGSAVYFLTLFFFLNSPVDLLTELTSDCNAWCHPNLPAHYPSLSLPSNTLVGCTCVLTCLCDCPWHAEAREGHWVSCRFCLIPLRDLSQNLKLTVWLGWQARELLGSARLWPAVLRLQACRSRTGFSTWVLGVLSKNLMLA